MTLHIMIAGRERYTAPFYSEDLGETASALNEHLPVLRRLGRVAVFVTDGNVAHIAARTVPALHRAIRSFIPRLHPRECANYFSHSGYVSI